MTDREMLELAAKAAGAVKVVFDGEDCGVDFGDERGLVQWNPRDDDGDAFRLRAKLRLSIDVIKLGNGETVTLVSMPMPWRPIAEPPPVVYEPNNNDPAAATRRAIFLVAVEIGKRWGGTLNE